MWMGRGTFETRCRSYLLLHLATAAKGANEDQHNAAHDDPGIVRDALDVLPQKPLPDGRKVDKLVEDFVQPIEQPALRVTVHTLLVRIAIARIRSSRREFAGGVGRLLDGAGVCVDGVTLISRLVCIYRVTQLLNGLAGGALHTSDGALMRGCVRERTLEWARTRGW